MATQHKDKRKRKRLERQTREARRQAERNPQIGYFAYRGMQTVCDGDGCVIAGSREQMATVLERLGLQGFTVRPTTFSEILAGLRRGGAYCFDEQAYGRLLGPAQKAGLPLSEEDFSDPGPTGLHFVRVQLFR